MFLGFLGMPFPFTCPTVSLQYLKHRKLTAIEITCRLALKPEFESNCGELREKQ